MAFSRYTAMMSCASVSAVVNGCHSVFSRLVTLNMKTQPSAQGPTDTSNLLNVARNRENTESLVDRKMVTKPGLVTQRAALGNISNKGVISSATDGVKGLKVRQEPVKTRLASKSSFPATIPESQPIVGTVHKDEKLQVKVETSEKLSLEPMMSSPGPVDMDMSNNSQGEEAFSRQMLKLNVNDIDRDDRDNPQLVSEYVNDIYHYLRRLEVEYPIKPLHLSNQTEVNGRMRGILIDWLVQVHLRFHLLQETLFLAVAIIDRYLQLENVAKTRLQLVGVASMWIAAKYEEMYAPEIADFVYITDNAYTKSDIRQMECQILKKLGFQLGRPLPLHFLRRNSKAGEVDANTHTLAKYFMELTVVEYDLAHLCPSEVAAASLCLSMKLICDTPDWTPTLVYYSGYEESQLENLMCRICQLSLRAGTGKLTAVKTKYSSSKLMRISKLPQLDSQLVHERSSRVTTQS